jgi:hypothetical protein
MGEEQNSLLPAHGLVKDLEIEIPERHAAGDRNGSPIKVILQYRRLSARGPRAAAVRPLA